LIGILNKLILKAVNLQLGKLGWEELSVILKCQVTYKKNSGASLSSLS